MSVLSVFGVYGMVLKEDNDNKIKQEGVELLFLQNTSKENHPLSFNSLSKVQLVLNRQEVSIQCDTDQKFE